jgi:hypothetical protein
MKTKLIRRTIPLVALLSAACGPGPSDADLRAAAETITEADVQSRVHLIAADSMGGRDTPSPGLEKTAAYIASEFERMGLEALGDAGGWYQNYGIRISSVDPTGSSITISGAGGEEFGLTPGIDASGYSRGSPDEAHVSAPLVVVGGGGTGTVPSDLERRDGAALLWATSADFNRDERQRARQAGTQVGAEFLLIAVGDDDPRIAPLSGPTESVSTDFGSPTSIMLREARVREGSPALAAAIDEVRASPTLVMASQPDWTATFDTRFVRDEWQDVPNVVGMVRGRDPALRDEYVVITAHFDHVGSRCAREDETDRICNGADDNASGTTGLLELAEAFAQSGARPRRSVIFAAVSGEERGLLGSRFFAQNPPVLIDDVVANINMDHLGRNWTDSIVIIGGEHSDLGPLAWQVAEAHPELNVAPLPDQWPDERIYFRSDHYNFAREGVPILFFTNGFHDDYHRVTDSPDKIDPEKQSRVVRYIFYVAQQIANQDVRPSWDEESYRQIVRPTG